MKTRKKIIHPILRILFLCLALTALAGCNWFTEHEYVLVEVTNSAPEDIRIQSGLISSDMMSNGTLSGSSPW